MTDTQADDLADKQRSALWVAELSHVSDDDLAYLADVLVEAHNACPDTRPKAAGWLEKLYLHVACERNGRVVDWNATLAALADGHLLAPEPHQDLDGHPYQQSCWCDWWGQYHELPEPAEAEGLAHLQEHGVDDLREDE